jgi:hypothetical protein
MLNPSSASQMPLSSRIALLTGLFLAGIFGLAATIILPVNNFKKTNPRAAHLSSQSEIASAPISSPISGVLPAPAAAELVKFCSDNVTEKRSFVLFRRGTCVVIDEPCKNPLTEATKKLTACVESDVRFISEPTREGDLIVTFKEPVFQRFSREELARPSDWLDHATPALMTPVETAAAGEGWAPAGNARYGLLARRRMLEDAANPVPVRIIRAKTRAVATN